MKSQMTVSMNGLRRNVLRSYNKVVRHLREHILDNLSDYECEELHEELDGDFDELRQDIGFLLCVFDPDGDSKFSDMSEEIDNLEDFSEDGEEKDK